MPSRPISPISNPNPNSQTIFKNKSFFLLIVISCSVLVMFIVCYFIFYLWVSSLRRSKTTPFVSNPPLKLQRFSYKELKSATGSFNVANVLGKGGSGTVYRGILRDGKSVAIKKLDCSSLQAEREFQNELQILGGLKSPPCIVNLLGFCIGKKNRILVYELMPNRSLQESLFDDDKNLNWDRRFMIILDIAKSLAFLHLECEPPVIHGDVKPSNVLLDSDYRARLSDFGLSRIKIEGEFGVDMFSQELSGNLHAGVSNETPTVGTPMTTDSNNEVDFALALQSYATKISKNNLSYSNSIVNKASNCNDYVVNNHYYDVTKSKGKKVSINMDNDGGELNNEFVGYDEEFCSSIDHSKEMSVNGVESETTQWGKDWWWRQDGSGELCSKDYVTEWIGTQTCPAENPDWDQGKQKFPSKTQLGNPTGLEQIEDGHEANLQEHQFLKQTRNDKKHMKMQEWWKEEHLDDISKKSCTKSKLKKLKWKKVGFKMPHVDLFRHIHFKSQTKSDEKCINNNELDVDFSFRKASKTKRTRSCEKNELYSGDLFSRELSSTTSMRGTLCYIAPEYGGGSGCYLMEKSDIYSFGVLILVIVSGRRPLHVLASPMKLEKANLVSWCRNLAQSGNILELVDERLIKNIGYYNKDQASMCITLALNCLQKMPELRPDIGDVVKILKGEMDLLPLPLEFSPSPPSKYFSRSRRKQKANAE